MQHHFTSRNNPGVTPGRLRMRGKALYSCVSWHSNAERLLRELSPTMEIENFGSVASKFLTSEAKAGFTGSSVIPIFQ